MSPILVALLQVAGLFAVCWATRGEPAKGKKWGTRMVAFIVLYVLAGVLSPGPESAVVAGEYFVYFGIAAVVIYMVAERVTPRPRA